MAISQREQLILHELEQQFAVARRRVTLEANVLAVAALAGVGLVFAGLRAATPRDPPATTRAATPRNRHGRSALPGRWPM
jgi:hypothetical protein